MESGLTERVTERERSRFGARSSQTSQTSRITTWLRIAVIALTVPLAAGALVVHWFAVGGRCWYYDGGPTGEQVNFL